MGNHYVKVKSTRSKIYIVTFNQSDILYWYYRELRHVPLNKEIDVSGISAGGYVKVGVIYDGLETNQLCCYDLFRVYSGATLTIESVSPDEGVLEWKVNPEGWGELLDRGRTIQVNTGANISSWSLAPRRHRSEDSSSTEETRRL